MKQFSGFPAKMRFTPIPNVFFSSLLPQISDIAELKITLHIFWSLYGKRGYPRFITYRELLGNTSLMNSLKEGVKPPDEALGDALEMAVRKGKSILPTKPCIANTGEECQIDYAVALGSHLVIAECKAVGTSIAFDRGDPQSIKYRTDNVIELSLSQVDMWLRVASLWWDVLFRLGWLMLSPLILKPRLCEEALASAHWRKNCDSVSLFQFCVKTL